MEQRVQHVQQLINDGRYAEADEIIRQFTSQPPVDIRLLLLQARVAEKQARLEDAVEIAEHACRVVPMHATPMLELARLHAVAKRTTTALQCVAKALDWHPNDMKVLMCAIAVAEICGNKPVMLNLLQRGVAQYPSDSSIRFTYAQELVLTGKLKEAQPHLEKLNHDEPGHPNVLLGLMSCALARGDTDAAHAYSAEALRVDPNDENIQYWHEYVRGENVAAPLALVAALYDGYAARYDTHLVGGLEYITPTLVAGEIRNHFRPSRLDLLDLGCGTGLVGKALGPIDGQLVGVDLSSKMIEQAALTAVYTCLAHEDLIQFLQRTSSASFDAVTCCEVLVHVGHLEKVFADVHRVLRSGGRFVFSCELAGEDEEDVTLRATGRYAHTHAYAQRVCASAGFQVELKSVAVLRKEKGEPVAGFIGVASKS